MLVEEGVMSISEAVDLEFVERFRVVFRLTCHCEREIVARMDAIQQTMRARRLGAWRRRPFNGGPLQ